MKLILTLYMVDTSGTPTGPVSELLDSKPTISPCVLVISSHFRATHSLLIFVPGFISL